MAVTNGQRADQQTFNDAFLSRTVDSDTVAIVGLNHETIVSGPAIPDTQLKINDNADRITQNETDIVTLFATKQDISEKDQPNGYAGLDANSKIAASALPFEAVEFKGAWDASTNTPTLTNGTGDIGDIYRVNVAGSQDLGAGSENYAVGDWVTYNGTVWERSDFVGAGVIDDLSDVDTTTNPPTSDTEVLSWDSTAMKWVPKVAVAQENLAWVPQGIGTWDGTTFDLVLDTDCYISVPPLPNDYHTIDAQTINFPNDGDVAYITIDRAAAATTSVSVTVTSIGSFVNNGQNIIIGRRVGTEVFVGIHDPQRFQDGDEFDLSKGGGGFTGVREANVIERKILSANVTTTGAITEIGWDDLVIGKTYEVRAQFTLRNDVGVSDADIRVDANHNGGNLARTRLRLRESTDTNDDVVILTMAFTFEATSTVLEFLPSSPSAASDILGNADRSGTYVELETRNDLDTNVVANNDLTAKTASVCAQGAPLQHTANGSYQTVIFDTELEDTHNSYNPLTGEYTAGFDQDVLLSSVVSFAFNGTGQRYLRYFIDGVSGGLIGGSANPAAASQEVMSGTVCVKLLEGQVLTVRAFQTSGGNLSYAGGADTSLSIKVIPDFSIFGVVNPNSVYLETVYADSTGNLNNPTTYVAPGPSAFEQPIGAGTFDVGYFIDMAYQFLGSSSDVQASVALFLDGVIIANTESYVAMDINTNDRGGIFPHSNSTRITVASPGTLSLRIQARDGTGLARIRMISTNWSASMSGQESAPKIWARSV